MSQKLIRWHSFLNVFIFGVAFIFVKIYILSECYLYQHFHCKTCKVYFLQIEMRYYVLVVLFDFLFRESSIFYAQPIYVFFYLLLLFIYLHAVAVATNFRQILARVLHGKFAWYIVSEWEEGSLCWPSQQSSVHVVHQILWGCIRGCV